MGGQALVEHEEVTMTVKLIKSAFVCNGAQSVAMSQLLSITSDGSNPAYLIVSGLDRNEYTASGSGKMGTLTGNGATAGFTQVQGDQREVGIVFVWDATTGTYRNPTYGPLMDLTYNTSPSPNKLADLTFFGTNDVANIKQFNNNVMAVSPKMWTDYGTATFATQSVGALATTQATPDPPLKSPVLTRHPGCTLPMASSTARCRHRELTPWASV
jgi:hypothetical protein